MNSSSIVPTFCYLTNIDVHMLAAILEIFGLLHLPRQNFRLFKTKDFNKVQLYKVPEYVVCAISICLRGFHRSAATAFQELQLLASSDKCPTAGQRKGKVIFRNEKHSFALIFSNVVVTVHDHHVKSEQTNYSYRKPIQFLLTNFHSQMALRVITEHVHLNLNPRTLAERAIKPSGGAWPIQVSIWVFTMITNLSSLHTSSP